MRDGAETIDIADELFEPGCIIIATLVLAALSAAMWYTSRKSHKAQDAAHERVDLTTAASAGRSAQDRGKRDALAWLAALVATSLLLLVVQVTAGFATGALTLIADSAHTAADTVSYGFSWFIERAKYTMGTSQSEQARRTAARFDAMSAIFSVALVLGTSACATIDAVQRLRGTKVFDANEAVGGDLGLIGPALLGFAVLSTVANCGLLAMHQRRRRAAAVPATVVFSQSEDSIECPSPPPPIACPPPPPPVDALAAPTTSMTVGRSNRSRERAERRKKQMAFLHQAFHPNCNDADCSTGHDITSLPAPDAPQPETAEKEESNLNLYGAVLHLFTDVLRSLVILVVGLLVEFGIIRDAPSADAICAIAVSLCIILGSVALLRAAGATLYRAWQDRPVQALGADFPHQTV